MKLLFSMLVGVMIFTSNCIHISKGDISLSEPTKQHLAKQTALVMSTLVVFSQRITPQANPCNSVDNYSVAGCGGDFGGNGTHTASAIIQYIKRKLGL